VVIEHDSQPRTDRFSGVENQDVELGVVDLPHRIGVLGSTPVDQFVGIAQRDRTVVRKSEHRRIQSGDDRPDGVVGDRCPALLGGDVRRTPGNRGQRSSRLAQRHAFDQPDQPSIGASRRRPPRRAGQSSNTRGAVAGQPALCRAQRNTGVEGRTAQRYPVVDTGPQHLEPCHRLMALRVGQSSQRTAIHTAHLGLDARGSLSRPGDFATDGDRCR
jgi:hypothetical protein